MNITVESNSLNFKLQHLSKKEAGVKLINTENGLNKLKRSANIWRDIFYHHFNLMSLEDHVILLNSF